MAHEKALKKLGCFPFLYIFRRVLKKRIMRKKLCNKFHFDFLKLSILSKAFFQIDFRKFQKRNKPNNSWLLTQYEQFHLLKITNLFAKEAKNSAAYINYSEGLGTSKANNSKISCSKKKRSSNVQRLLRILREKANFMTFR